MTHGYVYRKFGGKDVPEHRIVVERVLGRALPTKVQIHHVDGNRSNNAASNLVVCEDIAYHKLLHFREKLLRAGANPNTERICKACGAIKPLDHFTIDRRHLSSGRHWNCRTCKLAYERAGAARRAAKDAEPNPAVRHERSLRRTA